MSVRCRMGFTVRFTRGPRSFSRSSSSSSNSSSLSFGGVVEDVQAAATGGNDVGDEFGAIGADVT